jgi:hypothetical protein
MGEWDRAMLTIEYYLISIVKQSIIQPCMQLFRVKKSLLTIIDGKSQKALHPEANMAHHPQES